MKSIRVGLGFDVHRFSKRRKSLILAGIKVAEGFGLEAVSDGDVVLHAICDGILGAACLGDIGDYFPPHNKGLKGIKSTKIVRYVLKEINKAYKIVNIDTTIVSQKPPLAKYKKKILDSLRDIFGASNINIKIKSKEGLGILGGKNALACFCIVLLEKC